MKTRRTLSTALGILATLFLFSGTARAGQIELSANQLFTTWTNINGALTVIAANTSMDDDWTNSFKAMAPEPADGKSLADVVSELHSFHAKLNAVLAANEAEPVALSASEDLRLSNVFLGTGELMDALVLLLIKTDPLAFIAQYYAWEEVDEKSASDVFSMAALANARMDLYMEENGIELPEAPEGGAQADDHAGHGGQ